MQQFKRIERVLIVGGTHGNEWIGAYLVKKLEQHPEQVYRPSFETVTLLANPAAFAQGRRYIDQDLNRAFHPEALRDLTRSAYESTRAREIVQTFGSKGTTPISLLIDLHSTTANMGLTIIVDDHPFNLRLAAYLNSMNPAVRIYCLARSPQSGRSLPSICPLGCTIEVGAVAQGVLDAKLFQETETLVQLILDYLERYNQGQLPKFQDTVTLYKDMGGIDYPRDAAGEIQAMIHPQLQFRDYDRLSHGDPIFLEFTGETILYEGNTTVFPIFINEAAYYEKGIAMVLTEKRQLELSHVTDDSLKKSSKYQR